jgi:beta-1,4-mannosyl-glycoprotein beta-1,4-N-acetylglucosaminyltransferase
MLIYDTIPFFNELDLLEIRLEELWPVVNRFVIQEATKTFSNQEKPLYFRENWDRFKKYRSKIDHWVIDDYRGAPTGDPMKFDNWQKHWLLRKVETAPPSTLVLVADTDEIVRAKVLQRAKQNFKLQRASLELTICAHWLNCVRTNAVWPNTKLVRRSVLSEADYDAHKLRALPEIGVVHDAGWHFTSLWPYFAEKIPAWGHQEYNRPPYNTPEHQEKCRQEGLDPFGRKHPYEFREDLSFLPRCVRDDPQRFKDLIRQETETQER